MLPAIGPLRPWADPGVVALGRLPMHVPVGRAGGARRSLDGAWAFALFDSPDVVPADAVCGPTPGTGRRVTVPGNWTVQDVGDLPHYTNVQMPFPGPPPALPARLPTGVHRRSFRLGHGWRSGRVVLHVGGAEGVHAVYLNGVFVGYGTDSRLPSEYDVTDHVVAGDNHLAIVVVRWSAQSYVEDQDQWWMAGLHRSVWVESRPTVHVADVSCTADLRVADGTGLLAVTTEVGFARGPRRGWTVRTWAEDLDGRVVAPAQIAAVPHRAERPYVFTGFTTSAAWDLPGVAAWSAESPVLHRVVVELLAPDERVADRVEQRVGFRHVQVRDRDLLVNGRRVWIFGVNRHDHHPDRGTAVTVDDMRADLVAMRRLNVNAVRASHYPNDDRFLDLCDELGFYVVDEANIESHAFNTSLCDDERYRATWLERGARMVQRDRNHPSVIMWSLGNESGYGAHHDALAGWIRRTDPSRPLHYEGAVFHAGWVDGGLAASDVVCPMYPTIQAIREHGASGLGTRPLIMCEYSHAMGNSNGSLAEYWSTITSTPGVQGGFLWEWKDHGIRQRLADGTVRLAYGGQFGDEPHDGNFVADGLMSSDLVAHPAATEVAWCHRPVVVRAGRRRGTLRVENRQSFTGLERFRASWDLRVDGELVDSGPFALPDVDPGSAVDVPLPCAVPPGRGEVHLSIRIELRDDAWYAPAGHLVACDQVELRAARARVRPLRVRPDDRRCVVDDVLVAPVELTLWRAPTDNDGFKLLPELSRRIGVGGQALARWQDAGVDRLPAESLVAHEHVRSVSPDGRSVVHHHVLEVPDQLADLPRIGVVLRLPGGFARWRWFGRGPGENYPDRCAGSPLGVWEAELDEPPYLVPQEFGLRTGCRWVELLDVAGGRVLRVDVLHPLALHASATRFTADDLYRATTETELRPRDETVVHLDVAHRGLGTASCGPDVLPEFRLPAGRFEFAYRLTLTTPTPTPGCT